VATGQLVCAAGTGGVGNVTREDCARAAAAALAAHNDGRMTLDITDSLG
jgi:NAD(P)H dehydrogenase (quinone)